MDVKEAPVGVGVGRLSLIPSRHRLACPLGATHTLQDVAAVT